MHKRFEYALVDTIEQVNFFLPPSSLEGCQPRFIVMCGATAVGKSEMRRKYYSGSLATIDAGDIFLSLCCNRSFNFPSRVFHEELEWIGNEITRRAFVERRNIVCELSLIPYENYLPTLEAVRSLDYQIETIWMTCDLETARVRNDQRGKDSISSYYTDEYHLRWINNNING